ncbi:MAG: hypothetical protein ACI308_01950 [Muribaculaceae bacterium]
MAAVVFIACVVDNYAAAQPPDSLHVELQEVGVTTRVPVKIIPREGKLSISSAMVNSSPVLFGNRDAMRTLQSLADVHTNNDFASGISVDGMDYSQNYISTNGARIINPFHMLGLFSTLNASHYSDYSFSSVANGRNVLGASLDARTAITSDEAQAEAVVGLINAAASVKTPLGSKGNTWIVASARQSYLDKIFPNLIKYDHAKLLYNFGDANVTVMHRIDDSRLIKADFFMSGDRMNLNDSYYDSDGKFKWNNIVANVRFDMPNITQHVSWSSCANNFHLREAGMTASLVSSIYELNYNGSVSVNRWNFAADAELRHSSPQHQKGEPQELSNNACEVSADAQYSNRIGSLLSFSGGMRLTQYLGQSITRTYPLPNLSLTAGFSDAFNLNVRAGALAQFSHLIKESDCGLPVNFWINSSNKFMPQHSWYGAIGVSGRLVGGMVSYNVEAYFRSIRNLPEFAGCILNMVNSGYQPLDDVVQGNGRSYGVKSTLSLNHRNLRMWASCAVGRSEIKIPEIADGYFPTNYDRKCDFKAAGSYQFSERVDCSLMMSYATGTPYTAASMGYMLGENLICEYFPHNSSRLPNYFRLDVSVGYSFKGRGRLKHRIDVSAYNVTAHRNVMLKYYNYSPDNGLKGHETVLASIIPSISYKIIFR